MKIKTSEQMKNNKTKIRNSNKTKSTRQNDSLLCSPNTTEPGACPGV